MLKNLYRLVSLIMVPSLVFLPVRGFAEPPANTLPTGGIVAGGDSVAMLTPSGNTLTVDQYSNNAIINYDTFNIGSAATVQFNNAGMIALNRVAAEGGLSEIYGTLTASGRIFLINPNGILFGQGSQINTAGLVASTLNMADSDFLAGRYTFVGPGGTVVNQGYISSPGGFVSLLGSSVENKGIIEANLGSVALASGNAVTLNLDPQGLISVVVDEAAIANAGNKDSAVKNTGTLKADGGKVLLTAQTLKGLFDNAINTNGIIEANVLGGKNGEVVLEADAKVNVAGTVSAKGGTVKVDSQGADISANISAAKAVFNMHDGDTAINGASFTGDNSGSYSSPGDLELYDNGNISLTGDLAITGGDLTLVADNDNSGSGDLTINDANVGLTGGDIWLEGANVAITDSIIETIAPVSSLGKWNSGLDVRAHNANGQIDVDHSQLTASVPGNDSTYVHLFAGSYSNVPYDFSGDERNDGIIERLHGAGSINIHDGSSILASIGSGYDGAEVRVEAKDVTIDNSDITSQVTGDGRASLGISAGSYDYYHQFDVKRDRYFDGGNLVISGGSSILSTTGSNAADWRDNFLNIDAGGIEVSGASSVTAKSIASGHAEVDINAYNHFERINDNDYPTASGGYLHLLGGSLGGNSILAQAVGSASADVQLNSGAEESTISIDGSSVKAELTGEGWANVSITSGDYANDGEDFNGGAVDIKNSAKVSAVVNGSGEAYINVVGGGVELKENASLVAQALGGEYDGAEVDITGYDYLHLNSGSSILAQTSTASDWSVIYAQGADILIDGSFLTAEVNADSGGFAGIFLGLDPEEDGNVEADNISILNGSKIDSRVNNGYSTVEADLYGSLNIKGSELSAISKADGSAYLDFNLYGEGNADFIGSNLLAKVTGEGHASITVYDSNNEGYWGGIFDQVASFFTDGGISSGPILGKIEIDGSTLHAEAASQNSDIFASGTALIGMMSEGPITVANSQLSTNELNGPSVIGLLSDLDISVDAASTISAQAQNGLAVVGLAGMGTEYDQWTSIDAQGAITADGGEGFGVVGLLGEGDVIANNITARGNSDAMPLLEGLLNDYITQNGSIELFPKFSYGSGVLLGSLYGNIILGNVSADMVLGAALDGSIYQVPNGLVKGHLLGLLAYGDIVSLPQQVINEKYSVSYDSGEDIYNPIKTDVDILAAYSFGYGDIVVDEANDIQLGLVLPATIHGVDDTSYPAIFGMAVAANEGDIFIRSQGDMTVNSVMAPYGGVFLQSEHGSMYAGKGWYPLYPSDLASTWFSFNCLANLNSRLEYAPIVLTSVDPEYDFYFPPYNIYAGGYSYLSTPEGTIGVGTPGNKDPSISGELAGMVRPPVEAVTGQWPSPGIDLSRYTPPGLVYYTPLEEYDPQIWPESIADPAITSGNPLLVYVDTGKTRLDTRALPGWFVDSLPTFEENIGDTAYSYPDFECVAGLTLEIGPKPENNPIIDNSALLANPLLRDLRAYYEVMSGTRFQSIEPATPTNFFGYHPLLVSDMTAFDDISLDAGAYDFISDNIKNKKQMAPYYGL